jgi:hypothetical protein
MSRLLILPHKAAVAVYVGAKYGGELTFKSSPRFIIPFDVKHCQIVGDGPRGTASEMPVCPAAYATARSGRLKFQSVRRRDG